MNRIKAGITEADVIDILTDILNSQGWYDSVDLIDRLEQVNSPLVTYDKNGDRKLSKSIVMTLKQNFDMEFDRSDKCWYKK